jgi:predicted small metal-binding protein
MDKKLSKISCDPACGFEVQSHDEKEVIDFAIIHAKDKHGDTITEEDAKAMVVPV